MNQNSVQLDQRGAYRIPISEELPIEVRLLAGDREIHAHLRNESSGGFGLFVEGEPPLRKDDVVEMVTPKGRFRVRIAYVRPWEDDSRIQVAEQDGSGEIRTVVDPDEEERFSIGVEVLEDLSFFQKPSKRRRIATVFQISTQGSRCKGERRIALVSLAAWFAFPTALFCGVAIAIHFGLGGGGVVTRDSNADRATLRGSPAGSAPSSTRKNKSSVERKALHSTKSSTKVSTHPTISLDEIYEKTPSPPIGRIDKSLRNVLSTSRTGESVGSKDSRSEDVHLLAKPRPWITSQSIRRNSLHPSEPQSGVLRAKRGANWSRGSVRIG